MADHHAPVCASSEDVARANENWQGFTRLLKVSLAAVILLLIGMALFLV